MALSTCGKAASSLGQTSYAALLQADHTEVSMQQVVCSCCWRVNVVRSPVGAVVGHWEPSSHLPDHGQRLRVAEFRPHTIR